MLFVLVSTVAPRGAACYSGAMEDPSSITLDEFRGRKEDLAPAPPQDELTRRLAIIEVKLDQVLYRQAGYAMALAGQTPPEEPDWNERLQHALIPPAAP